MATALVVGTVIGSGVFKKPQAVADSIPYSGLAALVWILGGLLAFLGALSLAEVSVLFPRAGGNYVFLREGYGRLAGFLFGWVEFWIIRSASIAALATIFAESLKDVLSNARLQQALGVDWGNPALDFWAQRWLTIAVILGLAGVNMLGVRWGGLLQLFITLVKVGSLIGIAALPFLVVLWAGQDSTTPKPQSSNLLPVLPGWSALDFSKIGAALVAVLWAYHGWMNFAPAGEEIKNPQRNIPIAALTGVGIVAALYLSANLGYYLIIPQSEMAAVKKDTNVAMVFSELLLGPIGAAIASAAVMCSVFGALNGNLLVGPRLLYAMGEDGLAPRSLGDVHAKFRTPVLAILVLAIWSCLLVLGAAFLLRNRLRVLHVGSFSLDINVAPDADVFDLMTNFAIFGSVTFETLALSTIFVFRRRLADVHRPYRCPGYPFVPLLYIFIMSLVLVNMFVKQKTEAMAGAGFIAVGAIVYSLILLLRKSPARTDPKL
jgi:amino acid transporter